MIVLMISVKTLLVEVESVYDYYKIYRNYCMSILSQTIINGAKMNPALSHCRFYCYFLV